MALLALVAVVGALVATRPNPVLTPDSVAYVASAAHLADGEGHTDVDGRPITLFAPGFAVVLAPFEAVGIDAAEAASVLNALLYGAVVVLGWRLARRHVASPVVAVLAAAALAVSAPLLVVSTRVWSEPLFVVVTLAFVLALERALATPTPDRRALVLAGALAGLSVLVRYQGLVLVGTGAVVLAAAARHHGVRDATRRVATYGAVAVVAPAAWALRNLALGTGPFGPRASAVDDLGDAGGRLARVLTEWLVPGDWVGPEPPTARPLVLAAALVLVAGAGVLHVRDRRGPTDARPAGSPSRTPPPAGATAWPLLPLVAQVALGTAWMVFTATITPLNPLDTRLLVFAYPGAVVLVAWAAERLVRAAPAGSWRLVAAGLASVLALGWFATSAQRWLEEVGEAHDGCCYPPAVLAPERHAEALGLPEGALVYTDMPDGLWLVERRTWRSMPARSSYRSADALDERPALAREVACAGEAWVVWYRTGRRWLFAPADLEGWVRVEPPTDAGSGLWRLTPLPGTTRSADC